MDASTIAAGYAGLKNAIEALKTISGTKAAIAADFRVVDVLEQLGRAQDVMFELRNKLAEVQEKNFELEAAAKASDSWEKRFAAYKLVTAPGGAFVYQTDGPPAHYACPTCMENQKVRILQDQQSWTGDFKCGGCDKEFSVGKRRESPRVY